VEGYPSIFEWVGAAKWRYLPGPRSEFFTCSLGNMGDHILEKDGGVTAELSKQTR
jgi:hypothetical protein